jgi:hypothetical protein
MLYKQIINDQLVDLVHSNGLNEYERDMEQQLWTLIQPIRHSVAMQLGILCFYSW